MIKVIDCAHVDEGYRDKLPYVYWTVHHLDS